MNIQCLCKYKLLARQAIKQWQRNLQRYNCQHERYKTKYGGFI